MLVDTIIVFINIFSF